ncbi:hypothetical protein ACFL59_09685, partial [Planctomycetota bacterium]
PGAMIGYRAVEVREARDKHGSSDLYVARELALKGGTLELHEDATQYERAGKLRVPVVDTGENGVFTRGEFAAITALGQMEYITPEELARIIVLEIQGANTGQDVVSGLDASVTQPSYKAGLLRSVALTDLGEAERESGIPSVALGRLGPPELSKLLFEAFLFKQAFGTLEGAASAGAAPESVVEKLVKMLGPSGVGRLAPSVGIPVLLPCGQRILRGPRINVPEVVGHRTTADLSDSSAVDRWASKGWIDLRASNMAIWQGRFRAMLRARADLRAVGSAAATTRSYMSTTFEIGEVVAWIFNNELGGYRVK